MPDPQVGFDFAVFDTNEFDETPETAAFITKMEADFNEPIFRLVINGVIYDDFVIDAPTISRGADIIAGATNIVLSNTPLSRIDSTGIAFVDSNPDTITDSNNGFVTAGFQAGDKITVSGATEAGNSSTFGVVSVAAGVLTLLANDAVAVEGAGALVSITSQPAFNFLLEDRIANMGLPCHLGLYFSGTAGYLYLLTGTVEDVSFEGATVTLSIRDAMAPMLEKRIGSGQLPADYYTTVLPLNPANLVFGLLTEWGGLDNTFSTDNIHINFTSWLAWRARCAARNYEIRARFPGTTIQNALLRIADLTNSFIWVDAIGQFQFTMFEPPYVADAGSDQAFDVDNSVSLDIDIVKSTIKNVINIYYNHDPDQDYEPAGTLTSVKIGFGNDNPDRIYLTEHNTNTGFLAPGFDTNDPITISGSQLNDGVYGLQTVENGVLTLTDPNGLTDEGAGASVTLTQSQDTSTYRTTSLVFNDTGSNDTITDVSGGFVVSGITANDPVIISGSISNDGTYAVDSVTANTITLDVAETLTQEPSGNIVILTQTHSITYTSTTIGFDDTETGKTGEENAPADHVFDTAEDFIDQGFKPQYDVTISGASETTNNGTYTLASVAADKLNLLHQTLADEASGPTVTITQAHTSRTTGKQFEAFISVSSAESIGPPGNYGVRTLTDEDKVVWHDNIQSAHAAAIAKIQIYKFPNESIRIGATMVGFLSDPGDEIIVTEAYKNIDTQTYFIKGVEMDIDNALAEITAERGN